MVRDDTEEIPDDDEDASLVDLDGEPLVKRRHRRDETPEEKAERYRSRPDAGDVQAENRRAAINKPAKGLKCPKCHCKNFRVLATRPGEEDTLARRRVCRACGYVFGTREIVDTDLPQSQQSEMVQQVLRKIIYGE